MVTRVWIRLHVRIYYACIFLVDSDKVNDGVCERTWPCTKYSSFAFAEGFLGLRVPWLSQAFPPMPGCAAVTVYIARLPPRPGNLHQISNK